ncbi:hypothetical protein [Burkholderia seminalis]|uniref:hypothetical protein n=1 Tax=Burkholderia seminalis TaxID=488731 RepID=UPI000F5AF18E|nr:hypothetical protein [Burkholderia seminalis]MCA8302907.1 hypothetical protein [Burkholderia seminalis]MCA8432763.1 hypothetical protein [Burkholderia seminalis]
MKRYKRSTVTVARTRFGPSVLDAGPGRRIRFEQVPADATQDRKVSGGVFTRILRGSSPQVTISKNKNAVQFHQLNGIRFARLISSRAYDPHTCIS